MKKEGATVLEESDKQRTYDQSHLAGLDHRFISSNRDQHDFLSACDTPMTQAKQEATKLAEQYANLEEVDQFYWFTREATYFSLTGQNDKGQDIAVIIPKSGERVKVLEQKAGLTEEAARQEISKQHPDQQVEKASLGMYKDEPVWEVITKTSDDQLNYYLLSFKTGEEVKVISGYRKDG